MNSTHIPNPFFDPASPYNRFRAASPEIDRTIGYFAWLKTKREAARPQLLTAIAAKCGANPARVVVVRLDQPTAEVPLAPNSFLCSDRDILVGRRFWIEFTLNSEPDRPSGTVPCRVLILDGAPLQRLRQGLASEGHSLPRDDAAAIRQLFESLLNPGNLTVAGILAAVPELNGSIDPEGKGSAEIRGLPDKSPNVPDTAWVVIVYDRNATG